MTSLGLTLASNIETELRERIPPEVIAEQLRQKEVARLNEIGFRFYEKAKKYFTEGIMAAKPIASLKLQVGGRGFVKADDYHDDVKAELDWYDDAKHGRFYCAGGEIPTSMADPNRFAASWEEFKQWAHANELEAYWKLGAAYGPSCWWFLHVKPMVRAVPGIEN